MCTINFICYIVIPMMYVWNIFKKVCYCVGSIVCWFLLLWSVNAWWSNEIEFELLPKATDWSKATDNIQDLWKIWSSENFDLKYNEYAKQLWENAWKKRNWSTRIEQCAWLWNQFMSGIMNWDTILCLAAQVVRFISNMALVVWAAMIVYAWYMYAMSVFWDSAWWVGKGNEAIKRAIIWIVIIIFSYAMLNFVIEAFL